MRVGVVVQLIPSSLRPAWSCMLRAVSSQRNTPANFPRNGTTAELKMLLAVGNRFRGMIGLRLYRHTTPGSLAGLSSHGMFGRGSPPTMVAGDDGCFPSSRKTGSIVRLEDARVTAENPLLFLRADIQSSYQLRVTIAFS